MDDSSGWNDVLLGLWTDHVRDTVVERIEHASVGRHGWLARVYADPDRVRPGLTETVHQLVLAALRDETGADLEALGSQAAWDCYEQVWDALAVRWRDGGHLATVPLGREPQVVRLLDQLPTEAAVAAAVDVDGSFHDPLWLAGRLRIDAAGVRAYLQLDGGPAPRGIHATLTTILEIIDDG
ncbi:MAG: hypothetical protein WD638_04500 [Nitriliruptoraceae bacterium]